MRKWVGTNQRAPLLPALSSPSPLACLSQLLLNNRTRPILGSLRRCGTFVDGRGDFSRQKLEFKLFLAGLFWAELQKRIKLRAINPGPSLS